MRTIQIQGGLGNQMFQYAFAKALRARTGQEVTLNTSIYFTEHQNGNVPRPLGLDVFTLDTTITRSTNPIPSYITILNKLKHRLLEDRTFYFDEHEYTRHILGYNIGYWCSEKYFDIVQDDIRKDFSLRQPVAELETISSRSLLDTIHEVPHTIAINVRRGEYATNRTVNHYHGLLNTDYYRQSLEYILGQIYASDKRAGSHTIHIFIVSDDVDWCKRAFDFLPKDIPHTFVPSGFPYLHLYVLRSCRYMIIANSTFSWWGAWLNEHTDKIVVRPKRWMAKKTIDTRDVCPANWIPMPNEFDFL